MGSKWGQIPLFWGSPNPRFMATHVWETSRGPKMGSFRGPNTPIWGLNRVRSTPKWSILDHFWTTFGPDGVSTSGPKQRENEGFRGFWGPGFGVTPCPEWAQNGSIWGINRDRSTLIPWIGYPKMATFGPVLDHFWFGRGPTSGVQTT